MKKLLHMRFLCAMMLVLCCVNGAWAGTDVLNYSISGMTSSAQGYAVRTFGGGSLKGEYSSWLAGDNSKGYIQFNTATSGKTLRYCGIVTTSSPGIIESVTIKWHSSTAADRQVKIYGSASPYDVYEDATTYKDKSYGTELGTLTRVTGTNENTFNLTGDYRYVAIVGVSGTTYMTEVDINYREAEALKFDISFVDKGAAIRTPVEITDGQEITFPEDRSCRSGWSFAGWSLKESGITVEDICTNSSKPVAKRDATYYAVFSKTEGEATGSVLHVTNAELLAAVAERKNTTFENGTVVSTEAGTWIGKFGCYNSSSHRFALNASAGNYLASPEYDKDITNIVITSYTGSGNGTWYIKSAADATENIATGTVPGNANETPVSIDIPAGHKQIFILASKAIQIHSIEITLGSVPVTTYDAYDGEVPVAISAAGYATLYHGTRNLVVPTGVTAHTVLTDGDELIFSKNYAAGDVIPAGTGVVLKGAEGSYTFEATSEEGLVDDENMLRGTDVDETTNGGDIYYGLSLNAAGELSSVGFYWFENDGAAFTNPAHKAYLALTDGNGAPKAFRFVDDDTTGISSADAEANSSKANGVYNLAGQKVSSDFRGIVIKNGKKVVIK